jgi:hypothetical protein
VAEDKWIETTYSGRPDFNRSDDFAVPVVLDWAIRNVANCAVAQRNMTDYMCRSAYSDCVNSTNGAGYRCKCSQGYEGNPYLHDGCNGIDTDYQSTTNSSLFFCSHSCIYFLCTSNNESFSDKKS